MAAMGKMETRSLPENTSLTADQQDEFDLKVKNIKQKVYLKQQIQFNGIKVKRKSLYY